MYCTECGAAVSGANQFCTNCGARAPTPAPRIAPVGGGPPTPIAPSRRRSLVALLPGGAPRALYIAAAIAVVLGGAAGGAWLATKGERPSETAPDTAMASAGGARRQSGRAASPAAPIVGAPGWYGWSNGVGNLGRDVELGRWVGPFHRVNSTAKNFSELCQSVGRVCARVVDWENHGQPCGSRPDGSRLALCT